MKPDWNRSKLRLGDVVDYHGQQIVICFSGWHETAQRLDRRAVTMDGKGVAFFADSTCTIVRRRDFRSVVAALDALIAKCRHDQDNARLVRSKAIHKRHRAKFVRHRDRIRRMFLSPTPHNTPRVTLSEMKARERLSSLVAAKVDRPARLATRSVDASTNELATAIASSQ